MERDVRVKTVFSTTERASVKMDGMRSNTLVPQAGSDLFTVGSFKNGQDTAKETEKLILKD